MLNILNADAEAHIALEAENERLRAAGAGYSQETVDALSAERDRYRGALEEIVVDTTDSDILRVAMLALHPDTNGGKSITKETS